MCTLTVAVRAFPEAPLLVAANRDERDDRPSEPPARWDDEAGIVAPRDVEAGGTWIGYNADGVFAGLANRWVVPAIDAERSRGLLVRDALDAASTAEAARTVEAALRRDRYDGFNLLIADDEAAVLFEWDGHLVVSDLGPGVHVVMNAGFDDRFTVVEDDRASAARRQAESARTVLERLDPEDGESAAAWLGRAGTVLADHEVGVCVHRDGFGTRSSSLIAFGADGEVRYDFADGPPCETAYRPVETDV